ncbi:MAG: hypothetical protein ACI4TC_03880 [Kiritimatiellia bacterium]
MSRFNNIPPEIAVKLDQSLSRVRRILFTRGLCVVLFAAFAAILLHMAVLAMLGDEFPPSAGWSLWGISLAAVGVTLWFALVRPMRRKFTAAEIASLIERNHPELEERLSTVVELAATGDLEASSSLLAEITRAAVLDAGKVSPKREFTPRTVKPRLLAALSVILILGLLFLVFRGNAMRLFVKALNPSSRIGNIYSASMDIVPNGDRTVVRGTSFEITLRDTSGGGAKAYVYTDAGSGEVRERMTLVSGGDGADTYSYVYPRVESDFSYRIKRGRALSDIFRVKVVDPPDFTDQKIVVAHPAYTGRPPDTNVKDGTIVGLPASAVTVSVRPNKPGLAGTLELPGDLRLESSEDADGHLVWSFELPPGMSGAWSIRVRDENGFENVPERNTVRTVRDEPPRIRLTAPEVLTVALPRTGELPLGWEIVEDFGLSRTMLEMCVGVGTWEEVTSLDSYKTNGVTWVGSRLEPFINKEFGDAAVARFRVKAYDNQPDDPTGAVTNWAVSAEVTVELSSDPSASSLARQSLKAQIEAGKKGGENIKRYLGWSKGNLHESGGWFRHAEKDPRSWQAQNVGKKLAEGKGNFANAERLLNELIASLEESRLQAGADMYRPLLDSAFAPARMKIDDIFTIARNTDKSTACGEAEKLIQDCINAFDEVQKRFDALSRRAMDLQKLEEYAEREKLLAELSEQGEIDPQTLADQQEKLESSFNEEFKDELKKKELGWQKDVAKRLEERAEKLAERQEALKEKAEAAKDGSEEDRQKVASEEKKLANDIRKLARETSELKNNVERVTGPYQDDPAKAAEPIAEAASDEWSAANKADKAAKAAESGDLAEASENMQAAQDALAEAKAQLHAAQDSIAEANKGLAEDAAEFREMSDALHAATEAAKAAAQEAAEQAAQQGGEQQSGEQQSGEQQSDEHQGGEQQQGGQQPSMAQQKARQAAMDAARQLQQMAQQQAEQGNLPFDQFQQDAQQQDGPPQPGGKPQKGPKQKGPQPPQQQPSQQQPPQDAEGEPSEMQGPHQDTPSPVGEQGEINTLDDGEDWFKMKGDVGSGADVAEPADVPEEYRGLVNDYFKAINCKGGK